jgi:hypothetical protein
VPPARLSDQFREQIEQLQHHNQHHKEHA